MIDPTFFYHMILQSAFTLIFVSLVINRLLPNKRLFLACMLLAASVIVVAMLFKPALVSLQQITAMLVIIAITYIARKVA